MTLKLDMIQTLALAAVVLFAGYAIRRRVPFLDRYNIPAPVVGGFLFAALSLSLRLAGVLSFEFDTTLQTPLMIAFFTSIGLGASLGLLKVGGPQVVLFWILASILAVLQNAVGVSLAAVLGVEPLLGLIAGSITMTGGHGTGAAFGRLIEEQYGFSAAFTLAMAAATFGLVSGGLIGGPVATTLIQRYKPARKEQVLPQAARTAAAQYDPLDEEIDVEPAGAAPTAYTLLKVITIVLVAMWAGGLLSGWLGQYITLPAYIGAMIVAAVMRNGADLSGAIRVEQRTVDDLGTIALSLFLSMALMTLRLWELLDLALPLVVILAAQVTLMALFAYFVTFHVMGRDYDAAVMAGGHCGFGLGATPNAVANMEAIVERFGPAPRAFLVLPMVGAFFIDFTNALIITTFINWVH
ncbi:MAG TPA: sodium/glutamate symporter [Vicinamibacterales bacterium]|nr:sodium/glutamate symporter [Vicinamibacterales bacterium]